MLSRFNDYCFVRYKLLMYFSLMKQFSFSHYYCAFRDKLVQTWLWIWAVLPCCFYEQYLSNLISLVAACSFHPSPANSTSPHLLVSNAEVGHVFWPRRVIFFHKFKCYRPLELPLKHWSVEARFLCLTRAKVWQIKMLKTQSTIHSFIHLFCTIWFWRCFLHSH